MHPLLKNELSLRVFGLDNLNGVDAPVVFFSNHSSHLDATLILTTLPDAWQAKTAVGAARDYFFDVWWRQAFTALVYGGFPIDRSRGGRGAVDKARELIEDGWSLVVFPEGTRSQDGHVQRFRHGTARLCLEHGIAAACRSRSSVRIRRCRRAGSGRRPAGPRSRSATAGRCIRKRARPIRSSLAGWRRRSLASSTRTARRGGTRCNGRNATRRRRSPGREAPIG